MYTEVGKSLDPALYPDIVRAGGLGPALQAALDARGRGLTVEGLAIPFLVYARVSRGDRHCQIMTAAHERAFSVDFWNQGVQYGSGWTSDLDEVERAVATFLDGVSSIEALRAQLAWFTPTDSGRWHERGAAEMVHQAWETLEQWL